MTYVYLLISLSHPDAKYIGRTQNLKRRLKEHNSGACTTTAPHFPWKLHAYFAFSDPHQAARFERYLKHGSGHAFAARHFWNTQRPGTNGRQSTGAASFWPKLFSA